MNNGELTAKVARALAGRFRAQVDILFDHGNDTDSRDKMGVIRSWFGDTYNHNSLLADLDIAVVLPNSDRAIVLIEVEESTASPKTILGDVWATLLGDHVMFQEKGTERRRRNLEIGKYTRLIVLSRNKMRRNSYDLISDGANQLKADVPSRNARVGQIVVDVFKDELDLEEKLTQQLKNALIIPQSEI